MTGKDYLARLETINSRIERKKDEIMFLTTTVESTSIGLKEIDVVSSGNQNRFADTMAKICDLKTELENLIKSKFDVISVIEKITDGKAYTAIYLRYVNQMSIKEIADSMDVSLRTVYGFLDKGIQNLDEILKIA